MGTVSAPSRRLPPGCAEERRPPGSGEAEHRAAGRGEGGWWPAGLQNPGRWGARGGQGTAQQSSQDREIQGGGEQGRPSAGQPGAGSGPQVRKVKGGKKQRAEQAGQPPGRPRKAAAAPLERRRLHIHIIKCWICSLGRRRVVMRTAAQGRSGPRGAPGCRGTSSGKEGDARVSGSPRKCTVGRSKANTRQGCLDRTRRRSTGRQ